MCQGSLDHYKAGNEGEMGWGERDLDASVCCGDPHPSPLPEREKMAHDIVIPLSVVAGDR